MNGYQEERGFLRFPPMEVLSAKSTAMRKELLKVDRAQGQ
jgi:hypothetical protein